MPELSPSAAPEFVDAASCKAWLEHVPLANVGVAQQQLLGQLVELNRFPISAANRLAVMESLREAVNFVQIEQARRFTNRALPLAEAEAAVFRDTGALWAQMRLSYVRCLDSAASGEAALRGLPGPGSRSGASGACRHPLPRRPQAGEEPEEPHQPAAQGRVAGAAVSGRGLRAALVRAVAGVLVPPVVPAEGGAPRAPPGCRCREGIQRPAGHSLRPLGKAVPRPGPATRADAKRARGDGDARPGQQARGG